MVSAISTNCVAKRWGQRLAVDGVTLSVPYGKVIGLLGPNGAGKTTLLRMLAGHVHPSGGEIHVAGHPLPEALDKVKNSLGFLTAGMNLYERLSVRENLVYFGRLRGMSDDRIASRIDHVTREFGLEAIIDERFGKLSSGQKQRSLIAATVLHDPGVLILDEVTASLDVIASSFMVEFVRRERANGKAIVFSTHIISEAEYVCDYLYLIHQGRLRGEGSPAELIARTSAGNLTEAFLTLVTKETTTVNACPAATSY